VRRSRSTESEAAARPVAPVRRRPAAAPLIVGAAGDRAEREADRLAHEVIGRLGRSAGPDAAGPDAGGPDAAGPDAAGPDATNPEAVTERPAAAPVRRAASAPAGPALVGAEGGALPDDVTARVESARGGGSALPGHLRRRMEGAFGTGLGNVRIHHDAESAQLNRMVSARAFTTGRDIFFGSGEYQPDTDEGQRVLAHELAHTRADGGVHRMIHRWDITAPAIDWARTQKIGTIDSGQAVWFFEDGGGDKLVVKSENQRIGLAELGAAMHESLSNAKSVKHRKLGPGDKQAVGAFLTDPQGGSLDRSSWSGLGRAMRANGRYLKGLREELGDQLDTMDDFEVGHYVHSSQWKPNSQLVAMTYAQGETAKTAAKNVDRDPSGMRGGRVEESRLRGLMTNYRHVQALGQLTAVDLFLGNQDRVMQGNLGNWIYDPMSEAMTVIDHVDSGVSGNFGRTSQGQDDLRHLLGPLTKEKIPATAKGALDGITFGVSHFAKDDTFGAWLDSDGGYRRKAAEEALERGLIEGRKLLIKTFTATRFSGSKKARAIKKSIKSAAREAQTIDSPNDTGGDQDYYYKVLKARAQYLTKH